MTGKCCLQLRAVVFFVSAWCTTSMHVFLKHFNLIEKNIRRVDTQKKEKLFLMF